MPVFFRAAARPRRRSLSMRENRRECGTRARAPFAARPAWPAPSAIRRRRRTRSVCPNRTRPCSRGSRDRAESTANVAVVQTKNGPKRLQGYSTRSGWDRSIGRLTNPLPTATTIAQAWPQGSDIPATSRANPPGSFSIDRAKGRWSKPASVPIYCAEGFVVPIPGDRQAN